MQPEMHPNYPAILAATLAAMVLGFLWYGPLFSKAWNKEMKMPPDFKPDSTMMIKAVLLQLVGALLTAYVLAHSEEVWRPSVWKIGADQADYVYGFFSGFFTWVGFYVPVQLGGLAWEGKTWKLFFINAGYYFVMLQAMGMILAFWR